MLAGQAQINLSDFMSTFVGYLMAFYHWTDNIYPFSDYPISLFWLFSSVALASLAYNLFPPDVADAFLDIEEVEIDDLKTGIPPDASEYYTTWGGYEDWEDYEHDAF